MDDSRLEVGRKWGDNVSKVGQKWTGSWPEVNRKWSGSGQDVGSKFLKMVNFCNFKLHIFPQKMDVYVSPGESTSLMDGAGPKHDRKEVERSIL